MSNKVVQLTPQGDKLIPRVEFLNDGAWQNTHFFQDDRSTVILGHHHTGVGHPVLAIKEQEQYRVRCRTTGIDIVLPAIMDTFALLEHQLTESIAGVRPPRRFGRLEAMESVIDHHDRKRVAGQPFSQHLPIDDQGTVLIPALNAQHDSDITGPENTIHQIGQTDDGKPVFTLYMGLGWLILLCPAKQIRIDLGIECCDWHRLAEDLNGRAIWQWHLNPQVN